MKSNTFFSALLLMFVANILLGFPGSRVFAGDTIHVVIPFNNCSEDPILTAGPGFSAWIEYRDRIILFDAGSDYMILLQNMQQLDLDFMKLTDVFISHNHWDHVFGIVGPAGVRNYEINTFVPESSVEAVQQQVPRLQLTGIDAFMELYPHIWSTGEMKADYLNTTISEQSLILEGEDGLVIITGCSHPGIETLVELVKARFPGKEIALLLGGFHLEDKTMEEIKGISDYLKRSGVMAIAPSHCTGETAIEYFRNDWGERFIQIFLGDEYRAGL